MIGWIFLAGVVAYFIVWLAQPDPVPFLGVYSQPGKWYWLKFRFMKFVIGRRQKGKKTAKGKTTDDKKVSSSSTSQENLMRSQWGGDGGVRDIAEMETKHELPKEKPFAADAVFFDGSNHEGWYFTLGTAQRQNDVINLFLIVRIPGVGTFVDDGMKINSNARSLQSKDEWKTANGFTVKCVKPMQEWKLTFKGKLLKSSGEIIFNDIGEEDIRKKGEEEVDAEFELSWTNFGDFFDFDCECSPTAIGHSLAIEPWSRELFKKMRDSHQTHYEQFGFLDGRFRIGEQSWDGIRLTSMRDHTITGYRRWIDLRRYIMMIYHLDDGTCIHTSVISMPETVFSQLEFGYVITPDKKKLAVDRVHFDLSHHGEDKHFPKRFSYSFSAGHLHYDVQCEIIETCSFKMGLDLACQVNENMALFRANGINGYGFAEVEYRIKPY